MTYQCKVIEFGTVQYDETVSLRIEILRKPLNLVFTDEQLAMEIDQIHFACYELDENGVEDLIACLILVPEKGANDIQMRQVAVALNKQHHGIGKKIVKFAENWALKAGYSKVFCHARDTAIPFYLKLGYQIIGDGFVEVGIPHVHMEKLL